MKQLLNAEETRESHRRISYHLKGSQKSSVDYILIPVGEDPRGPFGKKWQRVQNKSDLETRLLQRNQEKLQESCISPFARGNLFQDIGLAGEGDGLENILRGEYVLDPKVQQRHDFADTL